MATPPLPDCRPQTWVDEASRRSTKKVLRVDVEGLAVQLGLVVIALLAPLALQARAKAKPRTGKRYPSVASQANLIVKTPDAYTSLKPDAFPGFFAADLPLAQAKFEAASQIPTTASVFDGKITTPAWRSKPTWMVVAGADKIINPELERWYARRAHSHVVEVAGASHSVYESRPKEVVAAIAAAAQHAQQ